MIFFFFKQKTAYEMRISDWSSDVCSSDLNDVPSSDFCFYDPFEPEGSIGYKQFDVALEMRWNTGSDLRLRVRADVLNVFNWRNWNQFEGLRGGSGEHRHPAFAKRSGDDILSPPPTFNLLFGLAWYSAAG